MTHDRHCDPAAAAHDGDGPAPRRSVYLHPGQIVVSREPCAVTTILGSCVAVCVWDPVRRVGGASHFVLPYSAGGTGGGRFGDAATAELVARIRAFGGCELSARLYGGASVLEALRQRRPRLGAENVAVARSVLGGQGIPVAEEDVGGERGRKIAFHTDDGWAMVRTL